MDPLDHRTEKMVPAKKKGREHNGQRWELIVLLEEGRHEEFMARGEEHLVEEEEDYTSDGKALCPDPSRGEDLHLGSGQRSEPPHSFVRNVPSKVMGCFRPLLVELARCPD